MGSIAYTVAGRTMRLPASSSLVQGELAPDHWTYMDVKTL